MDSILYSKTAASYKPISILNLFFLFLIASYLKFFYLIPLPGGFGLRVNQIIPMLLTNVTVVLFIYDILTWKFSDFFYKYIICFMCFLGIEIVYTVAKYPGEPIVNSIKEVTTYTNLFSYCVFIKIARKNYDYFLKVLVNSCTFVAFCFIVQCLLFNFAGLKLLRINRFDYGEILLDYRNGRIRLIASDLVTFVGMLSIGLYYSRDNSKKQKKRYLINVFTTVLYELFSSQTRSSLLGFITFFVLTSLIVGGKNKKKKLFFSFVIITCLIAASGFIINFFGNIRSSIINKTDYSMYHRIFAYGYYISTTLKSPLFGIGLLNDEPLVNAYERIVHGNDYFSYCYSDVGFVGTVGKLGILGGLFYILPMFVCLHRYLQTRKFEKNPIFFVIFLIIAFSLINLSFFDAERIMLFPILMCISEIEYVKIGKKICMKKI